MVQSYRFSSFTSSSSSAFSSYSSYTTITGIQIYIANFLCYALRIPFIHNPCQYICSKCYMLHAYYSWEMWDEALMQQVKGTTTHSQIIAICLQFYFHVRPLVMYFRGTNEIFLDRNLLQSYFIIALIRKIPGLSFLTGTFYSFWAWKLLVTAQIY